jgi:hypothetical protein
MDASGILGIILFMIGIVVGWQASTNEPVVVHPTQPEGSCGSLKENYGN